MPFKTITEQQLEELDSFYFSLSLEERKILLSIMKEVKRAKVKHPDFVDSISDGINVIQEEAGEISKEYLCIKYEYEIKDYSPIFIEAVHTAATCFRFIETFKNKI